MTIYSAIKSEVISDMAADAMVRSHIHSRKTQICSHFVLAHKKPFR